MCVNPSHIYVQRGPGHEKIDVSCGQCWRCRSNRVNDYVGRSLCEASTSDWVCVLTLTYRDSAERDHDLAHKYLQKLHFQKFIRALRDSNHKIRYLAVGEYGDLHGRAHFHTILFGRGKRLEIPHKTNAFITQWPHGHVSADWDMDEKAIRYTCKYLQAPEKNRHWFTLSKKPPLGHDWFMQKARAAGSLGVLPRSFLYMPPGGDKGRPYMVRGATKRDYIREAFRAYCEQREPDLTRLSEWVRDAHLKVIRFDREKRDRKNIETIEDLASDFNRGRISPESVKRALRFTELEFTYNPTTSTLEEDAKYVKKEVEAQRAALVKARHDAAYQRILAQHFPQANPERDPTGALINSGLLLKAQS